MTVEQEAEMPGIETANYNGDEFERIFDLRNVLWDAGYYVDETNGWVYSNNERIGIAARKVDLHRLIFDPLGINMKSIVGVRREPDDFFLNFNDSCLYVIEKKSQQYEGSKDDTIQAAVSRRKEYWTALESMNYGANTFTSNRIRTAMSYVLNDWYRDEKYAWRLRENEEAGIPMLFCEFPLSIIGLDPYSAGPFPEMLEPNVQPEPATQEMLDLGL